MAVTYFGNCNSDGTLKTGEIPSSLGSGWNGSSAFNNHGVSTFTCPGSGAQIASVLQVYALKGASAGNVRLAIYSSDRSTKIGEGSAEVAVTGAVDWYGHTGLSIGLVGGTDYVMVASFDGATTEPYGWTDFGGIYGKLITADYTGGFPASLGAGTDYDYKVTIRCGVEPQAASTAVTGTATASITEADIVTGGKTLIITLTGDTFIPSS